MKRQDIGNREPEAVLTTIVGGRPPGRGKKVGDIPRGIELLTKKAAVDAAFRKSLMEKRAQAAEEIGLDLEPAEAMMLNTVAAAQLESIIAHIKVNRKHKAVFMGKAAALMLAALGTLGCSDAPPTDGTRPDRPRAKQEDKQNKEQPEKGDAPPAGIAGVLPGKLEADPPEPAKQEENQSQEQPKKDNLAPQFGVRPGMLEADAPEPPIQVAGMMAFPVQPKSPPDAQSTDEPKQEEEGGTTRPAPKPGEQPK